MNHELSFFISNLQKKAVESGLEENCLIPNSNENDRRIFEYINNNVIESSRPTSAVTGASTISKMSNSLIRDCDPAGLDATMRSSFYSTKDGFNSQRKDIVDKLKVKNVLELSNDDLQILQ